MPMNLHSFARFLRSRYLEAVATEFPDCPVGFLVGTPRTLGRLGLHLHAPAAYVIESAVEQAMREGFETIYIYAE